jgi:hypothetical protein
MQGRLGEMDFSATTCVTKIIFSGFKSV